MRIAVCGYIVRGPLGGLAWHHLQYVKGLADLGHEVLFIEDSEEYDACYDPVADQMTSDPGYGLAFAARAFARLGLGGRWAYFDAHTNRWLGPAASHAPEWCQSADVLIDISGVNPIRAWLEPIPARILIDTDPAFTQIKAITDPGFRERVDGHNLFFTFAENVATGRDRLPDDNRTWHPTRQPVVIDAWPVTPGRRDAALTTVMAWESYPALEHNGIHYGTKSASFEAFLDFPERAPGEAFELAIGSPHAPRRLLASHGWRVIDPRLPTLDPWIYQAYLQGSKAEFSVAKRAYVATWSGWFSERSTSYLASGRPCVVEDTGFSEWLPIGEGILVFRDPDSAIEALARLNADYRRHCEAARWIAVEFFDARVVLAKLIDDAMGLL